MAELQELLKNREVTSVRLVTMPEKMVVEETKRNYMYMNLYNFNVDGLYINRILPADLNNDFFEEWIPIQKRYLGQLEECFQALPIVRIPWYDEELKGRKAVNRICTDALAESAVFESRPVTGREVFEQNASGYLLTVDLPYVKKGELDLYQANTDVVIRVGNFKRNIPLPNVLRSYGITSAKLADGKLRIQFEKEGTEDEV